MSTTIIHSTGTITPVAVEGYKVSRQARTLVHSILNREDDDISLREFGLRSGSFRLVFEGESAALAAYAALCTPQMLTINNPDVAALGMAFVIADGDVDLEQDSDVANVWRVIVPFREVTA